ncbi:MFS transporter, partial [Streptomyces sp. NPDC127079]|uniref:MFS transporter n=1 Tax=Streptomyces sp. NPDC127079 TaxID=3347132 RepID=UPI003656B29D
MAFAESAGGGEASRGRRTRVPLLAVCAGYFMVILDVTALNVAAPVIGRELSASLTGIQWITDGYTLVFAGFLLTGGALGDRLGNRRVFCSGVAVFTLSSAACALAVSAPFLVAARLVEGLGAALIVPGSLALLQQAYPEPAARSRAFGLWGSMAGVAAAAGPLLGGLLVATLGWRWVFLVNLPVGAACLLLTLRHVARSPRPPPPPPGRAPPRAGVGGGGRGDAARHRAGRRGEGGGPP